MSSAAAADPGAGLLLAEGGHAKQQVVISAQASEQTKSVAAELAKYLGQITGAKFDITTGDGSMGIVLSAGHCF